MLLSDEVLRYEMIDPSAVDSLNDKFYKLPHFEPLGSLERYFQKEFRLESAWNFIVESSETATEP